MKTALILKVESEEEFNGWKTMLPMMAGGNKEAVLIIGYPEDSGTKANYSRSGLKVVKIPYDNIMSMSNQLRDLLGNDKYDIIFEHGLERPELYLNSYTTVKNPGEAIKILNSMKSQKNPTSPSHQPAPQKKEEPKEKAKENKKKKAKEEKTEEKKEEEKASVAPPGTQEKEKEEKEAKTEKKEEKKEEETGASPEKEKEEEKEEKGEGDGKEKKKGKEKDKGDEKEEEEKKEKQITFIFDPYAQENYKYLYPKKYMRTSPNSDDMKEWKDRWFGEQVYVSRLALMQAAWIICEVLDVNEVSNDDALQVIQLITRCRSYEDFNSSASNVLSNGKLRFSIDKNDPTSQDVAAASFKRLSQVASWYTTLSRLLTEKIQISK